jgi:diguanylate cyclase (GGDEF)-like protein
MRDLTTGSPAPAATGGFTSILRRPMRGVVQEARGHGLRSARALAAGLCAAALLLFLGPVGGLDGHVVSDASGLVLLAAMFTVAELVTVEVHFRHEAHSFTFGEIPIVLGLHLLGGSGLVLAQLIGSLAARSAWRRQPPIKRAFNIGLAVFDAGLAAVAYELIRGDHRPLGLHGQAATFGATVLVSLTSGLLIALAIQLSGGQVTRGPLVRTLVLSLAITVTNTAMALMAVTLIRTRPGSAWLLVAPCATIYFAYRAFAREKRERQRMNFLYSCSRDLHEGPNAEEAVAALLVRTTETFRAARAELVIFPTSDRAVPLRTSVGPEGRRNVMVPLRPDEMHLLTAAMSVVPEARLVTQETALSMRPYLHRRGVQTAMVAPLQVDRRVVGLLMVGNPLGDIGTFEDEDLLLLDALAGQLRVFLEFDRLGQAFDRLSNLQGQLVHQANHDPLTSLANRVLFVERTEEALTAGRTVAVMFVDLDDFKTVNDGLGHDAGDQLLKAVAQRLEGTLRTGDLAARLGGDEFAILVVTGPAQPDPQAVAERVLEALTAPFSVAGEQLLVRASVGVAVGDGGEASVGDLLRKADVAMYVAKHGGKGRAATFDPSMDAELQERLHLETELQRALAQDALEVVYQPVVDLTTGAVVALEALARWDHPQRGLIPPDVFVPVAERCGLAAEVGRAVLDLACRRVAALPQGPTGPVSLSVNVSARELTQPGFVEDVLAAMGRSGLRPSSLIVEVTERAILDAGDDAATLTMLRARGVRVAVDDFGTGNSSLSYLRSLPLDLLKVDPSFVAGLGAPDADRTVTSAIVGLAATLGLGVVAEGVETAGQVRELVAMGCTMAQGHHLAPPLGADQLDDVVTAPLAVRMPGAVHQ